MLLFALSLAQGAQYEPELEWRTLETEHFNITFHQGEEQLANELGFLAEDIHDRLTADMQNEPKRPTEVVLVDHTDVANGYAMRLPVNTIVIFVTAPQEGSGLSLYEDWLGTIMTHEYAHILHLDTVRGPPQLLRYVLGRVVSVNDLSPWWIVEGSATFQETRHTTGGRGRSTNTDMIIRMSVLEDGFPELGQMDGFLSQPPGGNARYLFGQSLLSYIHEHTSDDAITRWNLSYGAWVPYWLPARQVFGKTFRVWYAEWKEHLEGVYEDQQSELTELGPITWPQLLMDDELDGSCSGARFSPSGDKMVFACSDRRDGPNVYLADADGSEIEVEVEDGWAKHFGWRPDGEAFAYSSTHVVNDYNLYEDVYFHVLGEGKKAVRLTSGKRARDPEFSHDGADLLVVTNEVQNNNLARMRIDQSLDALTEYTDHTQLSTPRYSPDGRYIALSAWMDGARDIWIFEADGTPYRRVTMDTYIDRDPTWSADGETLYFSSDRTGISNIYAVDLETEQLWQVTNVLSGAFQPSARPDNEVIAWQHYTHNGYRVALMELDRETWWDRGLLPQPLGHGAPLADCRTGEPIQRVAQTGGVAGFEPNPGMNSVSPRPIHAVLDQPVSGPDLDDVAEADEDKGEHDEDYAFDHTVREYDPLGTLFPPRYVLPTLYSTTTGLMGALSTSGVDTLRRHGYSIYATYRTDANFAGGGFSYTWNRWKPVFSAGAHTYVVPYGSIYRQQSPEPGANIPVVQATSRQYWDQRTRVWTSASVSRRERTAIYARYTGVNRAPKDKLGPTAYREFVPTRGFLSTVGGGWRYAKGKVYTYSIAPEDARVLALDAEWTAPWLGSYTLDTNDEPVRFNRFQLSGEVREYKSMPWSDNHVLAMRGAAGVSFGDQLRYGAFRLGGNYGESGYYRLPDEWKSLRGYPVATAGGNGYYLGSVEYRMPLKRLDWGPGTLPLFLRTLHGAAFIDIGDAFDQLSELQVPTPIRSGGAVAPFRPPLVGVGAELRLGTIVGWGLSFNTRAGYAIGLTRSDYYTPLQAQTLYFRIGSSF